MMNNKQLEMAMDEAQRLLLKLTEARTLRWHQLADTSDKAVKSAILSLEDVAEALGYEIVSKDVALERLIENRTVRGQIDERIKAVEKNQTDSDRNKDQIAYRVTVMETSLAAQQQQQQKFGEDMSEMKGDMKVIKEAVLRLDSANKRLGR